jgi:CRISPR-associated endonuclease Csn1
MKGRKKGAFYLRRNAAEVEETFRNRNLGDTRYATRVLLGLLKRKYPDAAILARPGSLTAKLRRAWGLEDLKKGPDGKRLPDDRHHALDALVVACTTQSMLQRLTTAAQAAERTGDKRAFDFGKIPPPGEGFREAAHATFERVFVSRPEQRRARGEAHAATIKQVRVEDGANVVYERKLIDRLTLKDLDLIPIPSPYGKIGDPAKLRDGMVAELRRWIEAGKPKDALPLSPKGDPIRKVRVRSSDKVAVSVRGGTADRGHMVRVDVFAKADRRGKRQFHLVLIYPHQVADRERWPTPPDRAVVHSKPEEEWTVLDGSAEFLFSLSMNAFVEVVTPSGEVIAGYFKGLHRGTAAITIADQISAKMARAGIGSKTLHEFHKYAISRLGHKSQIVSETRTWHGAAST